jgi:hypothetical protein
MSEYQNYNPEIESEAIDLNKTYKTPHKDRLDTKSEDLSKKEAYQTVLSRGEFQTQQMESSEDLEPVINQPKVRSNSDTGKVVGGIDMNQLTEKYIPSIVQRPILESQAGQVISERVQDMPPGQRLLYLHKKQKENPNYFSEQVPNANLEAVLLVEEVRQVQGQDFENLLANKTEYEKVKTVENLKKYLKTVGGSLTKLETNFIDILKMHNIYEKFLPKFELPKASPEEALAGKAKEEQFVSELLSRKSPEDLSIFDINTASEKVDPEQFHEPEVMKVIENIPTDLKYILDKMDDPQTDWEAEAPEMFKKFEEAEEGLNASFHLMLNASSKEPVVRKRDLKSKVSAGTIGG